MSTQTGTILLTNGSGYIIAIPPVKTLQFELTLDDSIHPEVVERMLQAVSADQRRDIIPTDGWDDSYSIPETIEHSIELLSGIMQLKLTMTEVHESDKPTASRKLLDLLVELAHQLIDCYYWRDGLVGLLGNRVLLALNMHDDPISRRASDKHSSIVRDDQFNGIVDYPNQSSSDYRHDI